MPSLKKATNALTLFNLMFMMSTIYSYNITNQKMLVEITESTFTKEILESPIPVVLAVICKSNPTSRLIEPLFLEIHKEFHGKAKVVIVNLEKNRNFLKELTVATAQVIIIYHKGKKLGTIELTMSPAEIKSIVKYVLDLHIFTSLSYYRLLMKLLGKIA